MSFLNDYRWKQEMCAGAAVTRGFCAGNLNLGSYVEEKLGITITPTPLPPADLQAESE
jgi:hypothetical protein